MKLITLVPGASVTWRTFGEILIVNDQDECQIIEGDPRRQRRTSLLQLRFRRAKRS